MSVIVRIVDGPVAADCAAPVAGKPGEIGAQVEFVGIARGMESGKPIVALDYEVYQPMAERQIEQIGAEITRQNCLLGLFVEHSRGRVPVGERSIRVIACSSHRGPALRAIGDFLDRLKQDVPIWKTPITE